MLGSFRILTVRGIPVRVHLTLLVVLGIFIHLYGLGFGLGTWLILFVSVLLHELGHALVAQRYGIRIAGITLHMLGGMALMARVPDKPRQEIAIAAAGPAVSLLLSVTLAVLAQLTGAHIALQAPSPIDLLAFAAAVNAGMFAFNLIPALPMDGGRIFRAALATRFGGLRATKLAAWVSRVFALVFIVLGFAQAVWSLPLIGVMLLVMVGNEERLAEAHELMRQRHDPLVSAHTYGPVIDVSPPRETREEFIDRYGRRWVVVTRLV